MALTVIITELTNDTHFILPIMTAIMVRHHVGQAPNATPLAAMIVCAHILL
jgi:H+/Cl- antiporter ClcA